MTTEVKLCKDCKHYRHTPILFFIPHREFAKCAAPKNIDLVNGSAGLYCSLARKFDSNCQAEGKFWEPK